ncbi:MAG: hypothetical protein IPK16_27105 [Anaerolineales bacterium]|nr:hypothetical protein [Anaerolineales bacterium]
MFDGKGVPIPNPTPPIDFTAPGSGRTLCGGWHLAKFNNILALQMPDTEAQPKLRVAMLRGANEDGAAHLQIEDGDRPAACATYSARAHLMTHAGDHGFSLA